MSETVSVVFRGQLQPGYSLEEAKAHATHVFKLTQEKCDAMFGGRPVILRKGIPKADLDAYLERLRRAGLQVEVRPDAPVEAPAAPAPTAATGGLAGLSLEPLAPPPKAAEEEAAKAEEMTCPQCGEVQPKRTLCRKCSVDMPRFIAAKERAEQEARNAERAARPDAEPSAAVRAGLADIEDTTRFFGFSFDQRVSRSVYFVSNLVFTAGLFLALGIAFKTGFSTGSAVFALIAMAVLVIWNIRMSVLRLHDCGWSGLWALLFLIGGVSTVLWLILLFKRGEDEENQWGYPAHGASGLSVIASLLALLFIGTLTYEAVRPVIREIASRTAGNKASVVAEASDPLAGFDPQRNEIVLYNARGCTACDAIQSELRAAGLHFTVHFIDRDADAAAELIESLERANFNVQTTNLPILVVNKKLLANNPPLSQIALYLKK